MSKRELDKRLDKIEARTRVRQLGILPIIDVTKWPEEDRVAFARADERGDSATCHALVEKHFGKLPERIAHEVVAIIVTDRLDELECGGI